MLHPLPGGVFDGRLQRARLDHLVHSTAAMRRLAESYVDLTGATRAVLSER